MSLWDSDEPVPRSELLKNVQGAHGLLCVVPEKIDAEILDAAGIHHRFVMTGLSYTVQDSVSLIVRTCMSCERY